MLIAIVLSLIISCFRLSVNSFFLAIGITSFQNQKGEHQNKTELGSVINLILTRAIKIDFGNLPRKLRGRPGYLRPRISSRTPVFTDGRMAHFCLLLYFFVSISVDDFNLDFMSVFIISIMFKFF